MRSSSAGWCPPDLVRRAFNCSVFFINCETSPENSPPACKLFANKYQFLFLAIDASVWCQHHLYCFMWYKLNCLFDEYSWRRSFLSWRDNLWSRSRQLSAVDVPLIALRHCSRKPNAIKWDFRRNLFTLPSPLLIRKCSYAIEMHRNKIQFASDFFFSRLGIKLINLLAESSRDDARESFWTRILSQLIWILRVLRLKAIELINDEKFQFHAVIG